MQYALAHLDTDGTGEIDFAEFRSQLRKTGFRGPANTIFQLLDIRAANRLFVKDLVFLDYWDIEDDDMLAKAKKSSAAYNYKNYLAFKKMAPFNAILGEYKSEYDMTMALEAIRPPCPLERVTHKGFYGSDAAYAKLKQNKVRNTSPYISLADNAAREKRFTLWPKEYVDLHPQNSFGHPDHLFVSRENYVPHYMAKAPERKREKEWMIQSLYGNDWIKRYMRRTHLEPVKPLRLYAGKLMKKETKNRKAINDAKKKKKDHHHNIGTDILASLTAAEHEHAHEQSAEQ